MERLVLICIGGINLIAFFAMGIDKEWAQKRRRRIPEKTLMAMAILGGGLGTWLAMYMFRHKTKHDYFVRIVSVVTAIQIGLIFVFLLRG